MDGAVANAASQAQNYAVTFQTPLAVFLGVIFFSIACAITFAIVKRSRGTKEVGGIKEGRDYDYIWKDGRIAGGRRR